MAKLGIIGGTGLYELPQFKKKEDQTVETPFGFPSSPLRCGTVEGIEVVFLARHGVNHTYLPEEINYRANIYAMKRLGVTHIISLSAVGSLQEHIHPGEIVVIDQFFDRTRKQRKDSFFGEGVVAHITFADPVCPWLQRIIVSSARAAGTTVHDGGTYVNMEGPAFSTRAESLFYKNQLQASVIGMTNVTEAKLAREAEMCYATLAMVTDYDSWRMEEEGVSAHDIITTLKQNAQQALKIISDILTGFSPPPDCPCRHALASALITPLDKAAPAAVGKLQAILKPYLPG